MFIPTYIWITLFLDNYVRIFPCRSPFQKPLGGYISFVFHCPIAIRPWIFVLIARETDALSDGGNLDIYDCLEKKLRGFGKKVFTKFVGIPGNPDNT